MQRVLIPHHITGGNLPDGKIHDLAGQTMGTTWSVRLVTEDHLCVSRLRIDIEQHLDAIVREMSHWMPDSDLGRFNLAASATWHALPAAFFEVLSYAMSVAEDSGGAYDPVAGALVNLWGFGPFNRYGEPGFVMPSPDAVRAMTGKAGWRRIELDHTHRRVRQPGGALLDLSAVAKGYGVDRVARYLEQQGILHYLVEVGGELRGAGMKPDGQPWWVALEQPDAETAGEDNAGILLALHGLAVATSGDYRRCFYVDGKRYSHTLDPRTGYPLCNDIASVTVVHESCMAADALSTALSVLGVEDGMCFAEARCLAARFLVRQGDGFVEHASSSFLEMLQ